jgi:hypothetical protein
VHQKGPSLPEARLPDPTDYRRVIRSSVRMVATAADGKSGGKLCSSLIALKRLEADRAVCLGAPLEFVTGSVSSLEDTESGPLDADPYAFGHLPASTVLVGY